MRTGLHFLQPGDQREAQHGARVQTRGSLSGSVDSAHQEVFGHMVTQQALQAEAALIQEVKRLDSSIPPVVSAAVRAAAAAPSLAPHAFAAHAFAAHAFAAHAFAAPVVARAAVAAYAILAASVLHAAAVALLPVSILCTVYLIH